jgi:hypothetical protein
MFSGTTFNHRHGAYAGTCTVVPTSASEEVYGRGPEQSNAELRVDYDQGTVRLYDRATNTFGVYNLEDSTTRTFYKPSSDSYWARNAPNWGKSPSEMTVEERRMFLNQALRKGVRCGGDQE